MRDRLVARQDNRNETADSSRLATLCTLWPCDLDLCPFTLVFIDGRDIVMNYPCAKFGDFSFSRFDFILRTHTHVTHRQTDRITDTILTHIIADADYWSLLIQLPSALQISRCMSLTVPPGTKTNVLLITGTGTYPKHLPSLFIIYLFSIAQKALVAVRLSSRLSDFFA